MPRAMFRPLTVLLLALAGCSDSVSPRAERVFYRGDGMASWGTVCELNRRGFLGLGERGYASVAHVTENGTPLIGPTDAVTVADPLSDWSFLGIDPARLDPEDYPEMRAGQAVTIHGFPARDRDGEVLPGVVYTDDPVPPFWWIELRDADGGVAAEGVIGGFSGSCVLDEKDRLVAVVHANGFSRIEGTTHTWAKVVPIREAIRQAQARGMRKPETMIASVTTAPAWQEAAPQEAAPVTVAPAAFREVAPAAAAPEVTVAAPPTYRHIGDIDAAGVGYATPAVTVQPPVAPTRSFVASAPAPFAIATRPYAEPAPVVAAPAIRPAPRAREQAAWRRCADCL